MLGRLGLKFAGSRNERYQRNVNEYRVVSPLFVAHLTNGFHERQRFNVTYGAADLYNKYIRLMRIRHGSNRGLDLICDVRYDLDGLAEVVAPTLLFDD